MPRTKNVTGLNAKITCNQVYEIEFTSKMTPDSQKNGIFANLITFAKSLLIADKGESRMLNMVKNIYISRLKGINCKAYIVNVVCVNAVTATVPAISMLYTINAESE